MFLVFTIFIFRYGKWFDLNFFGFKQDDTTSSLIYENKTLRKKIATLETEMSLLVPKLDFGSIVEDSDIKPKDDDDDTLRDSDNDTGRHIADNFDTARPNDATAEKLRASNEEIENLRVQVCGYVLHANNLIHLI